MSPFDFTSSPVFISESLAQPTRRFKDFPVSLKYLIILITNFYSLQSVNVILFKDVQVIEFVCLLNAFRESDNIPEVFLKTKNIRRIELIGICKYVYILHTYTFFFFCNLTPSPQINGQISNSLELRVCFVSDNRKKAKNTFRRNLSMNLF